MTTHFNILKVRKALGAKTYRLPHPHGPAGFTLMAYDGLSSVIVSQAPFEHQVTPDRTDMSEWIHASVAHYDETMPTYGELVALKDAVWGPAGEAYQVFPPFTDHVSIHDYALHLWGRADGARVLPNLAPFGSI